MVGISTIDPAITENAECIIIKVHTPVIDIKVGVSPQHGVSLCFIFQLFKHLATIPSKE